mmetsp:Transcript_57208/g.185921  ORF Transcript_57208/g.185921 Transcript_57208/m.185921 type:complete len:247 (+) Transcript_57208:1626-2366(+)
MLQRRHPEAVACVQVCSERLQHRQGLDAAGVRGPMCGSAAVLVARLQQSLAASLRQQWHRLKLRLLHGTEQASGAPGVPRQHVRRRVEQQLHHGNDPSAHGPHQRRLLPSAGAAPDVNRHACRQGPRGDVQVSAQGCPVQQRVAAVIEQAPRLRVTLEQLQDIGDLVLPHQSEEFGGVRRVVGKDGAHGLLQRCKEGRSLTHLCDLRSVQTPKAGQRTHTKAYAREPECQRDGRGNGPPDDSRAEA